MKKRLVLTITFIVMLALAATIGGIYAKTDDVKSNGVPFQELRDAIDGIQDVLSRALMPGDDVSSLVNDAGYLTSESDPVFEASVVYGITGGDIAQWEAAYGWGDHSVAGYLTDETDPVFLSSVAYDIYSSDISRWDAAYDWGDHASVGYLTSEEDPVFKASAAYGVQGSDIVNWNTAYSWGDHASVGYLKDETDPVYEQSPAGNIQSSDILNWNIAYGWGDHRAAEYLTGEIDPLFTSSPSSEITGSNIISWEEAYSWGDHAAAGYLTSEDDPVFRASAAYGVRDSDIVNWNSVQWDEIIGVPEGFADGIDNYTAGNINSLSAADGSPINAVYVDAVGRVGIGTTTPRTGLHVVSEPFALLLSSDHDINWPSGEALSFNEMYSDGTYTQRMRIMDDGSIKMYGEKDGHLLYLQNDGDGGDEDGIYIQLGDFNPGKNNNYVTFADKDGDTIGRIEGFLADEWSNLGVDDILSIGMDPVAWAADRAMRNHGVIYATGNGDYAEYLPKLYSGEEIKPYDIVGVYNGLVSKQTEGAQKVMVVSLAPAMVGNMPPEAEMDLFEPIAFLGQVLVKVRGAVNVGDYILPSGLDDGTGVAVSPDEMTVQDYVNVVGVAWSGSEAEGLKYVLCAVGLNTNDVVDLMVQQENQLSEQQKQIDELKMMLNSLIERVDELEGPD